MAICTYYNPASYVMPLHPEHLMQQTIQSLAPKYTTSFPSLPMTQPYMDMNPAQHQSRSYNGQYAPYKTSFKQATEHPKPHHSHMHRCYNKDKRYPNLLLQPTPQ